MDRSLKERTIGAIVLVAFAVLVVPVFLDGPSDDSDRVTAAVTLPGQNDQPRKQQTIVLERDRSEPVPSPQPVAASSRATRDAAADSPAATGVTGESSKAPAAKTPPPKAAGSAVEPKNPPAERESPTVAASETGMWAVQLGSFSNRANAEKLAADLRNDGFAAFLSRLGTSNGELHRVRIGPQKDRDSAETVASRLNKSGHKGQVVPHP